VRVSEQAVCGIRVRDWREAKKDVSVALEIQPKKNHQKSVTKNLCVCAGGGWC